MPLVEALAAILGIIVAVLTIIRSLSGPKTAGKTIEGTFDEVVNPPRETAPPPLSRAEFERQAASMPVEWVTYDGMTPPLKLKIRGTTEAMYRQFARKHINAIGEEAFNRMTPERQRDVLRAINAELYVLDWEGACYANGNAIPFSAPSLELMLQRDPDLDAFLNGQVKRISPSWTD
ncbi:MAG TPA: hypothetical protein VGG48_03305 [Rhizomicrobium sp.]|jgi:hypothetical protein